MIICVSIDFSASSESSGDVSLRGSGNAGVHRDDDLATLTRSERNHAGRMRKTSKSLHVQVFDETTGCHTDIRVSAKRHNELREIAA